MAANNPPTLPVVRSKTTAGTEAPVVIPLVGSTQQLGTQIGANISATVKTSAEEAYSRTESMYVAFLDDEYVACGQNDDAASGVFKRNHGGVDQWGKVYGPAGDTVGWDWHSGIWVIHPNGVPTLAFLFQEASGTNGSDIYAAWTTDGINWTDQEIDTQSSIWLGGNGTSIAYRTSIAWMVEVTVGSSSNKIIHHDFELDTTLKYSPGISGYSVGGIRISSCPLVMHVHRNNLFFLGAPAHDGGSAWQLRRFNGTGATRIWKGTNNLDGNTPGQESAQATMFTDPVSDDLILICPGGTGTNASTPDVRIFSCPDADTAALGLATVTDISTQAFANAGTLPDNPSKYRVGGSAVNKNRRFTAYVDNQTVPGTARVFIWTTSASGQPYECWEWKNWDGVSAYNRMELVASGAGVADFYALPNDTAGGGHRQQLTGRVEMEGVPTSDVGGVNFRFRGYGTASGTVTFYVSPDGDPASTNSTVAPIVAASLTEAESAFLTRLEAYYKFNDDALDSSGNGRDLTLTGSVTFATGLLGNAADFPGTNGNYYSRANDPELNLGSGQAPFGISIWVNTDTLPAFTWVASKSNDTTDGWWILFDAAGKLYWYQFTAGADLDLQTANGVISDVAGWQHIAVTSDGVTTTVYVDNAVVASASSVAMTASSTGLYIGNRALNDNNVNGQVDEAAFWSRYITPAEVALLYNSGSGRLLEDATTAPGTPTISGNTITGFQCDGGRQPYSIILDLASISINSGDRATLTAMLVS